MEDPEEIFLSRESFRERMETLMGQLSGFEASVLRLYLNGLSYSEIAGASWHSNLHLAMSA